MNGNSDILAGISLSTVTHSLSASSRRSLVKAAGVALASSLFESCIGKIAPFNATCCAAPSPQAGSVDNNSLLTIDAHCHIFNGSDLPAKHFLTKVEGEPSLVGDLAQLIEWSVALTGKRELRVLRHLEQKPNASTVAAATMQQEGYKKARKAILKAPAAAMASSQPEVMAQIKDRMQRAPDYATYKEEAAAHPLTESVAEKDWALVVQSFRYRYEMIEDYLNTFMKYSGRCMDLMVAAMVDYDWWLEDGKRPKTPLPLQARVMEQISIMSRGRVHGMAPFDPLREVAYRAGRHRYNFSSLAFVQNAVHQQGFIGVKLYPSMGFAPWLNSELPANFWDQYLPESLRRLGFAGGATLGEALDEALRDLYLWCVAEDVPVLTHSSMSNGPTAAFKKLAGSAYWKAALYDARFANLRISFGHLGDFNDDLKHSDAAKDATNFVNLMTEGDGAGSHAFADVAYSPEVVTQNKELGDRIRQFYATPVAAGQAPLARRLMYGTDWNLLVREGDMRPYFDEFVKLFAEMDTEMKPVGDGYSASQRFFGHNAVDWMGLKGGKARTRLNDFYARNKVDLDTDPVHWTKKVG